jgi:GAF domain-containing protein
MAHPQNTEALKADLYRRERELAAVYRITAALYNRTRLEDLIQQTLLAAMETAEAAEGSVLLHDAARNVLVFRYVESASPQVREQLCGREMPVDRGIAGAVFQSGRGMISGNVLKEARHYREIDRSTRHTTRDLVCVPLKTTEGRVLGVMEVLNRRQGEFDDDDLEVLEILSAQAAAAIETATLYARVLQAEVEKEQFMREVVRCVTHDRLHLVEAPEIPDEGRRLLEVSLEDPSGYATLQKAVPQIGEEAGMRPEDAGDLLLALGEAVTNAIKHATGGRCTVSLTPDRLVGRVTDLGAGIQPQNLAATIFMPGFSTKISLGMGYTLMLKLVERVWLATGPEGTVVQLEKWLDPRAHVEPGLPAAWERL